MPIKNTNDYLEFDDYHMTIMQPFMIHADFECYKKRIENNTDFEDHKPYTLLKAEQVPYSFAVYTHCLYDKTKNKQDYYTGINCLEKFTEYLKEQVEIILNTKTTKKAPASKEFLDKLRINTICFICSNKIDYKDAFIKNRFNCKQTGKLLGLIHKDCKERINKTKEITVAFHNGSKYDLS